ncbi:Hypothetical predicted protein [Marmota monax]|uniref:Ectonucleotide pyrophosphatase/phosphodiesterase family member 3 n=1 Tax=Marmota monax TaxID=9995 RepID=A0A5E4CHY4_MARMO|nr:Hypothetical predicted protein [Marmota monax]
MDSMLTLATEEPAKKNTVKKYKIICIVLLALLVILSLGLGLGLGLRAQDNEESCRRKCFDSSFRGKLGCRCDEGCRDRMDCCWDFISVCVESTQIWSCSSSRCGESRKVASLCSCAEDCLLKRDCCANYKSVCQGKTSWVEEGCTTAEQTQCPEGFDLPPVILFSMDGFRAEYLDTWSILIPHINKLKTCGIHSKYMRAVYPTKTFPNHYTIVTGLYPESHGIIDNNMYDVHLNKNFSLSSKEKNNPAWWKGQPIWLTAMYQGLKAAAYYWPGSDVAINGSFPTIYKDYNGKISYGERVSTLLKWLDLPKAERPNFYTIYVEEPDSAGHDEGPVSGKLLKALQLVDSTFGLLMEGLKQRNLHNCVNIIILADHGMDQTACDKVEYMTDYFPQINFYMYEGPAPRIRTRNVPEDFFTFNSEEIVMKLSCQKPDQHFKPYLTPDLPKRLHYAKNIRIDKVHLMMDPQWLAMRRKGSSYCGGGNHGYNNEFKSMQALFLAHGPSFKEQTEVEPFENIEVYNLLCDLLRIQPAPNNGTHGSLNHLLKVPFYEPSHAEEVSTLSVCGVTTLLPTGFLNCSCPKTQDGSPLEELNEMLISNEAKLSECRQRYPLCNECLLLIRESTNLEEMKQMSNLTKVSLSDCKQKFPLCEKCLSVLKEALNLEQMNLRLNLTEEEIIATMKVNLPFGRPRVMQKNKDHCLLYHREYITGFAKAMKIPMWSSYTVPKPQGDTSPPPPTVSDCLRVDVRVTSFESQNCSLSFPDEKITYGFLYPPANSRTSNSRYDALVTSNMVPMYEEFKKMWDYFQGVLLIEYATKKNGVNVISGPIFDYNYDGHFDTPDEITEHVVNSSVSIPTHFFVVLTSCKNQSFVPDNCPEQLDVLPFIIPHRPTNVESCPENKKDDVWIKERFKAHIARVRDVELLTGLDFYQEKAQPVSEILQLKTYLPPSETSI